MSSDVTVVWFRRDLRLTDNWALMAAVERGRVLPVFIHAPDEEAPWRPGAASNWWLHHSLVALDQDLSARAAPLTIQCGDSQQCLERLIVASGATAVFWNELYEPALVERDSKVKAALEAQGVEARSFNAALLLEPGQVQNKQGSPFRVFTPFWKSCLQRLGDEIPAIRGAPATLKLAGTVPGSLSVDQLQLRPTIPWDAAFHKHWTPGEAAALDRLEFFIDGAVDGYDASRDVPHQAGTSRLSPHLHFGEIGPRQIRAAVEYARPQRGAAANASLRRFLAEVGWREFAHHVLFHFPQTATQPLNPKYAEFPWWRSDQPGSATQPHQAGAAANLRAWQRGDTGIALVDAGMRELWSTGWMHNRVRMVVASLLTKNLGIHWLEGARWFWDTLVDADLASNTLGWQWTAGCGADAAPYFRIFNPDTQAQRFDPDRIYRDRWLPPAWADREPIVDLRDSRQAALAAYASVRQAAPGA